MRAAIQVLLSPEEAALAIHIGMMKTINSIDGNLNSSWERPVGNIYDPDINGFGAEMAFCKLINVFADLTSHNRRGGYDCKFPNGVTVDVKQTKDMNSDLRVKSKNKRRGDSDIYALMVREFPAYTFVGLATEDMVFSAPETTVFGKPHYTLKQSELLSVRTITDYGVSPKLTGKMVMRDE